MKSNSQHRNEDSRPRSSRKRWIAGSFVTLILLGWLWWSLRWPAYDEAKVHPKLRGLQHPFQTFRVSYMTDGGTITLSGKDRAGRKFSVILPNRMLENQGYELIVVDGTYRDIQAGTAMQEPMDPNTRYMLARFIRDYEQTDPSYAEAEAHDVLTWKDRVDCPLGQRLLRHKFPLCLDFDW
jgi:hypothetical protein